MILSAHGTSVGDEISCYTPLQSQDESRVGILVIFWRERGELRHGWRAGRVRGWWVGFLSFSVFHSLCVFSFICNLFASARLSRTQTGRFVTCDGGGHGAR